MVIGFSKTWIRPSLNFKPELISRPYANFPLIMNLLCKAFTRLIFLLSLYLHLLLILLFLNCHFFYNLFDSFFKSLWSFLIDYNSFTLSFPSIKSLSESRVFCPISLPREDCPFLIFLCFQCLYENGWPLVLKEGRGGKICLLSSCSAHAYKGS